MLQCIFLNYALSLCTLSPCQGHPFFTLGYPQTLGESYIFIYLICLTKTRNLNGVHVMHEKTCSQIEGTEKRKKCSNSDSMVDPISNATMDQNPTDQHFPRYLFSWRGNPTQCARAEEECVYSYDI